jgi:hypothetical protein
MGVIGGSIISSEVDLRHPHITPNVHDPNGQVHRFGFFLGDAHTSFKINGLPGPCYLKLTSEYLPVILWVDFPKDHMVWIQVFSRVAFEHLLELNTKGICFEMTGNLRFQHIGGSEGI